jgi:hypothetical protein
MASRLTKPVSRETDVQFQGRNIIVTLEPPGTLALRAKGTRTTYRIGIAVSYLAAARAHVERQKPTRRRS